MELDWGKHDHVNVIKILRDRLLMNIPEGHIVVQSGDKLVVMGGRQQIENFCRQQAQLGVTVVAEPITLKEYIANQQAIPEARQLLCCGVTLDKSMPESDKSVRDSGIKQDWSGILIGLERDLLPIHPRPQPDPPPRRPALGHGPAKNGRQAGELGAAGLTT